jgi:hypothetical protein
MLTWMEEFPSATPVDMPPLDNHAPLLAAIYSGQGEYEFSANNKVLFYTDDIFLNGWVFPKFTSILKH